MSEQPQMIKQPLVIIYPSDEGSINIVIMPREADTHEHFGLLIYDLVRHTAKAFKVSEDDVWGGDEQDMEIASRFGGSRAGMSVRYLGAGRVRIAHRIFEYEREKEWFGNWCWNGLWMRRHEARRLLRYVRDSGKWHCEGGPARLYARATASAVALFALSLNIACAAELLVLNSSSTILPLYSASTSYPINRATYIAPTRVTAWWNLTSFFFLSSQTSIAKAMSSITTPMPTTTVANSKRLAHWDDTASNPRRLAVNASIIGSADEGIEIPFSPKALYFFGIAVSWAIVILALVTPIFIFWKSRKSKK